MRLRAFFLVPIIGLTVAPTQIAATVTPSSFTATETQTSIPKPIAKNSILQNGATVEPSLLIAQESRTRRMRFERGDSSAVVEDAVVRGTRDLYLLGARKRQTMTISITSVEKNAVFDIETPDGRILKQEATSWRGVLPATGDYRIVVGGTRGNAAYRLQVSIN